MSEECVVAVYDTVTQARDAVAALSDAGFPTDRISLVTRTVKLDQQVCEAIEFGDETERDAAIGAGAGVLLGLLSQAAVVAISGMSGFLVAGPAIAAGIVGGLFGAAIGWGIHKDHIHNYEEILKQGKVLVIAHGEPFSAMRAEHVLKETDPDSLHLYAETSADSPEIERT